jgi:hypothetical protein
MLFSACSISSLEASFSSVGPSPPPASLVLGLEELSSEIKLGY